MWCIFLFIHITLFYFVSILWFVTYKFCTYFVRFLPEYYISCCYSKWYFLLIKIPFFLCCYVRIHLTFYITTLYPMVLINSYIISFFLADSLWFFCCLRIHSFIFFYNYMPCYLLFLPYCKAFPTCCWIPVEEQDICASFLNLVKLPESFQTLTIKYDCRCVFCRYPLLG